MARLRREASFGMRLAHPNICHIIRLGETEDGPMYIVMPFVEGEVLVERTNRLGQIPLDETVRLVNDMAAGLQAAHDLKIVHRDLKPENIMVRSGTTAASTRWSWISAWRRRTRRARSWRSSRRRDHSRHAGVHESRATARQSARPPDGHLCARSHDVRDAHREAAVPGTDAAGAHDRAAQAAIRRRCTRRAPTSSFLDR